MRTAEEWAQHAEGLRTRLVRFMRLAVQAMAQVEILQDRQRLMDAGFKSEVQKLEACLAEDHGPIAPTKLSVFSRVCIAIRAQRSVIERQRETIQRQREKLAQRDVPVQNAWRWTLRRDAEAAEEVKKLLADMPEKRFFGQETLLQIAVRAIKRLHATIEIAKPYLAEDRQSLKQHRLVHQEVIEALNDALVGLPEFRDNFGAPVWDRAAACIARLRSENADLRRVVEHKNLRYSSAALRPTGTETGRFQTGKPTRLHVCANCGREREVESRTLISTQYKPCRHCGCIGITDAF